MRTTLTIDDDLLAQAKVLAARTHRSIGSVFEEALSEMILRHERAAHSGGVELPTFAGDGLQPGVDLDDKEQLATLLGDNEPAR